MDASIFERILQSFKDVPEVDARAKIGPRAFVIALITAVVNDTGKRGIASLRRTFIGSLGETFARSTFWQRLSSKRLTEILSQVIRKLVDGLSSEIAINRDILAKLGVTDVFIHDSSSVTLPHSAKKDFPAPRSNVIKASIKWHLCLNLFTGIPSWFCLTDARTHDRLGFPPLKMLKGTLIVFDLGYWDYNLLSQLTIQGTYFLSRVKEKARIEITGVTTPIEWKAVLKKNLFDVNVKTFRGNLLELIGTIYHEDLESTDMRVLGFWNKTTKSYHWYVTNLSIPADLIYPLYRIRWQVELSFKAAKSSLSLADTPSSNRRIILNILMASITSYLIAQPLASASLSNAIPEVQAAFSIHRAAKIFVQVASDVREYLISPTEKTFVVLKEKMERFVPELIDPNYRSRATSMRRLAVL